MIAFLSISYYAIYDDFLQNLSSGGFFFLAFCFV